MAGCSKFRLRIIPMQISSLFHVKYCANYKNHEWHPLIEYAMFRFKWKETSMIGLLKNKSQYYMDFFFLVRDGVQYPRIFPIYSRINPFTQEILPLLPKKLRTTYSRNLSVPTDKLRTDLHSTLSLFRCQFMSYRCTASVRF